MATEAKEEEREATGALKLNAFEEKQSEQQPESHVYIDESSGEKKVSNSLSSATNNLPGKSFVRRKVAGFERNLRTIRKHRFIIYDEICV